MQNWLTFYEVLGGAAATLMGLLFVSVSLNAETILGPAHRHSKRLAEQAFQNYMCVLLVALLVFFPGMDLAGFGYAILSATVVWSLWVVIRMYQTLSLAPKGENRLRSLRRYIPSFAGFAALIFSGIRLLRGENFTVLAAVGEMLLLISATMVSWELLIRVAEEKYAAHRNNGET